MYVEFYDYRWITIFCSSAAKVIDGSYFSSIRRFLLCPCFPPCKYLKIENLSWRILRIWSYRRLKINWRLWLFKHGVQSVEFFLTKQNLQEMLFKIKQKFYEIRKNLEKLRETNKNWKFREKSKNISSYRTGQKWLRP